MTEDDRNDWQGCRQGEVGRLVERLKDRRRAERTTRGVVAATAVLTVLAVGYYFAADHPPAEPRYGGIVCSEVRELAPRYMRGEVEDPRARRIEEHLAECPMCQDWLKREMPEAAERMLPDAARSETPRGRLLGRGPRELPAEFAALLLFGTAAAEGTVE